MTAARLAVPAYFHPAVGGLDWATLAQSAGRLRAVVFNVQNGPGQVPDPVLLAASLPVAASGIPLLGYVDTDYGQRAAHLIRADIHAYRSWYPVTGFFLDRVATHESLLPWYERIVAGCSAPVVFNHGAHPDPGYAALADALVTFEGPWSAYRSVTVPDWVHGLAAERFWHLVYATPGPRLGSALRKAAAANAGTVYVTERVPPNPWDALPKYFDRQARLWGTG